MENSLRAERPHAHRASAQRLSDLVDRPLPCPHWLALQRHFPRAASHLTPAAGEAAGTHAFGSYGGDAPPHGDTACLHALFSQGLPRLKAAFSHRRSWDPDPEELWSNLLLTFLEVIRDQDSREVRPVVRVLVNRACSRAREVYRRRWRELALMESLEDLLARAEETRLPRGDDLGERDLLGGWSAKGWLQRLVDLGYLSESESDLLWATRVEGWTVAEYARRTGECPPTVLKRRQRVEARLRQSLLAKRSCKDGRVRF